jgi:hypothetical protein
MKTHHFTGIKTDKLVEFLPEQPVLSVVVDTEEEFDWDAPFDRGNTQTQSIQGQRLAHDVFDPLGIKPAYVMDQAIVEDNCACLFFEELANEGRCEIGAHLHAWLTPPFEEEVNNANSFQCNLPYELEKKKMEFLRNSICERFGSKPTIFKAGRYGVGPHSYAIMNALDFKIDCSVLPYTSYHQSRGPNFYGLPKQPFWVDDSMSLLAFPLTRGFTGFGASLGPTLKGVFDQKLCKILKIPALFSRANIVRRVTLTPEGVSAAHQKKLLKRLYDNGDRYFSLAYHSSSLGIGHTPYVQSRQELHALLANLQEVLVFFQQELGGKFMSLSSVYNMVSTPALKTTKGNS